MCEYSSVEQRILTVHEVFEAVQHDGNYLKRGLTVEHVSKYQFMNQKVAAS